ERWVAARGQVFHDGSRPVRFVGTVLDVTDRKRFEHERSRLLSERESALRTEQVVTEASRALATSLDSEASLRALAAAALPFLGDFCLFDVSCDGARKRVASSVVPARLATLETIAALAPIGSRLVPPERASNDVRIARLISGRALSAVVGREAAGLL